MIIKDINRILIFISILLLISSPTIAFLGLPFYVLVCFFGYGYLFTKILLSSTIKESLMFLIIVSILVSLYFFWVTSLEGEIDIAIALSGVVFVGYVSVSIIIRNFFLREYRRPFNSLLNYVFLATYYHSILIVVFLIFPDLRESIGFIFQISDFGSDWLISGARGLGLNPHSGESIAAVHAIGASLGFYLRQTDSKKYNYKFKLFIPIATLLVLSRVGLVIFFLLIIFIYIRKLRLKPLLRSVLLFSVIIGLLISLIPSSDFKEIPFISRTLEPVNNFLSGEGFRSRSTDKLLNEMLFLPDVNPIYGSGNFGRQESLGFIQSDIGYVRLFSGGGILGVLAALLIPFLIFLLSRRFSELKFFGSALLITWLAMNLKVLWIIPLDGVAFLFSICCAFGLQKLMIQERALEASNPKNALRLR